MSRKLTKEIVNERLKDRGIELIGEYLGNKIKTDFQCGAGHIWSAIPSNIMAGKGCVSCWIIEYSKPVLSKDIVNQRLLNLNKKIKIIGDYYGGHINTDFECEYGHVWKASPSNIMAGRGCPLCNAKNLSEKFKLPKNIVNERIRDRGIELIGEYLGANNKATFQCCYGHIWSATPGSVMAGNGCSVCNPGGYNSFKPGYIYILDFGDYIKYGITNNLNNRLKQHLKNGEYTIAITKLYENGRIAQKWESDIKIIFGGRFVTKEIMPDGYTETLSSDKLNLLLDTIK